MALNNFKFFDINYGYFNANIAGTNLQTSTAIYGYDNRSDTGYVDWTSSTGSYVVDFGSSSFFNVKDLLILDHNLKSGYIAVYTGTAWLTVTTFANLTTSSYYYSHASTLQAYDVMLAFNDTQDASNARMGEFVITKEKFTLNYNPDSTYSPSLSLVGNRLELHNGRSVYSSSGNDVFQARISWQYLFGSSLSMTGTDLDNMTELARQRCSFLFWPNADNSNGLPYTWRKQDIYKCKVFSDPTYQMSNPSLQDVITADYVIQEVG